MGVDEGSDQKSDVKPQWMAAHERLKNEFVHKLMSWLSCFLQTEQDSMEDDSSDDGELILIC